MLGRTRWFITPALFCQLLLALALLTRGLLTEAQEQPAFGQTEEQTNEPAETPSPPTVSTTSTPPPQTAIIHALLQEKIGDLYHLRGEVEIDYKDLILHADDATYNDDNGTVVATGHVVLDGGPFDEHIIATHGTYNLDTQRGRFYDVAGTTGYRFRGKRVTLVTSSPFAFTGKIVDKVGIDRYIIHHGTITSCELPRPKWRYAGTLIKIRIGSNAQVYNGAFEIKDVPLLYLPYLQHPVEKLPRQSGFLMPVFGTSSNKGFILGDSFYWAINRSMDATLGAEMWTARGWEQSGLFRARPSATGWAQIQYFGVLDRGTAKNHVDETGEDVIGTAASGLRWGTRGVITAEYLSSYGFRQTFSPTFAQAINSEVISAGFLSKNIDGFSFNTVASRYQNFQSPKSGDVITILRVPALEASTADRELGSSRLWWSFEGETGGLSRSEPGFDTDGLVGRSDLQPQISYVLVSHGWTLRPEIAVRDTIYSEQLMPAATTLGTVLSDPINRKAIESTFELRPPALARIFAKKFKNHKLKHVIEPRLLYTGVRGVNNFARIIRFDDRDILSDTSDLEIGLVNRLFSKPVDPECEQALTAAAQLLADCANTGPREVVRWELGQKLFFDRNFGGALVSGVRNVFTTTADFTGIAFLTDPRRLSPEISRLSLYPTGHSSFAWDLDYDSSEHRVNASSVFADYHLGEMFFGAGHTYLITPGEVVAPAPVTLPGKFNQFRLSAGYGDQTKTGFTAASTVGYDLYRNFIQFAAVQSTYNWDCCGVTVEYRRFALGALRNENEIRFALTLANVGTYGTLRPRERIY
jgi:LPS-assembly protein